MQKVYFPHGILISIDILDLAPLYQKLRKNLGAKNCEFAPEQIEKITHLYLEMQPAIESGGKGISKIFDILSTASN
ncbi:hypothetical protein [Chamaesiphon sp.]|uniref:hypothetical protein n=1 Tax=Chamaesiphon sp. TaxID=2814140 RepID=UPI00359464FE